MFKDNLAMLRNIHGFSQEQIAEKINISRQAYAKWETGATVPDVEKCKLLADAYGVTMDSMFNSESEGGELGTPFAPKGKNIWGSTTINDRGQIVIPKEVREKFGLVGGTRMIVLSDESGIALVSAEQFEKNIQKIMDMASAVSDKE